MMMMRSYEQLSHEVVAGLEKVCSKVVEATSKANRNRESVSLIAVSKSQPSEKVEIALEYGYRIFGENRVQEAMLKWDRLKPLYPDTKLHLIGNLQTNKVKEAVALFDFIHSVDRKKLASVISRELDRQKRQGKVFIQVNTGEEAQKAGVLPNNADDFIRYCREELGLPVIGLMCIPPKDEDPALHFAFLAEIAKRNRLKKLSMGMSADFEKAIYLGATHIRVGTAIFGPRKAFS